jgi:hypothetical protein
MPWSPNGYASGGKPTIERMREYDRGHAVGMVLKAMHEVELVEEVKKERKLRMALKEPLTEVWEFKKQYGPHKPGLRKVDVRRDVRGRFSKRLTSQELARHFGLKLGSELPPRR